MAYEIELTVGDRIYHYVTLESYRNDMERRTLNIRLLNRNYLRSDVSPERKAELVAMLREEIAEHEAIMQEAYNKMKESYT